MEQRRRLFEPLLAPKGTLMSVDQFKRFAAYNKWANARLYAAVLDLSETSYRLHVGVFFGNLHGTLNHLLLTDRLWLKRLTGEGDHPNRLDAILYEDRMELARARVVEDERLIAVIEKYDEAALKGLHSYKTTSGMPQSQVLGDILMHLFNHQTHHRGQAHACLSILTGDEPPSLDLLVFQRGGTSPDLEKLASR
jgi:uncharacterized damage-inducible protein DinB